jgi:hypothetical protein
MRTHHPYCIELSIVLPPIFFLAQGRPGCSRRTCMLVCIFLRANGTRDRGCGAHPVFPAPSDQEGGKLIANLGRNASRDRSRIHSS